MRVYACVRECISACCASGARCKKQSERAEHTRIENGVPYDALVFVWFHVRNDVKLRRKLPQFIHPGIHRSTLHQNWRQQGLDIQVCLKTAAHPHAHFRIALTRKRRRAHTTYTHMRTHARMKNKMARQTVTHSILEGNTVNK